jgi:para-nitrobenzyl esterase
MSAMPPSRRRFFRTMGAGAAGLTIGREASAETRTPATDVAAGDDGPVLLIGENVALADTRQGRVRGYVLRGIHYYLGIPYGAPPAGANRFLPPRPAEARTNVFPAIWWGNSAPQNMDNRYANPYAAFRDHWNYDDVSEDCLRLNVFTPAAGDGRKRPVIVWLHGGGFVNGNGIEQDGYNGENLARFGDVVFVSLNHRLGPLGYTNLAGALGERFASSGNAGMLDIVAALEWVRDNIAGFGGDPGNVTIIGQSGGGAKVCTLTAMPKAKGLFHKAVVLSGAALRMGEKAYAEKLGAYVLQEAGLTAADAEKLQAMPWKEYLAVAGRALDKMNAEAGAARGGLRRGFNPVVDGLDLPQDPYYPEAAASAANVPMMICSTLNEISPAAFDPTLDRLTLAEVAERVKTRAGFGPGFGDRALEVVQAYAAAFPGKKPAEVWSLVSSTRQNVVALADAKSKQPAPVYVAWFTWQPPIFDGRLGAFHCADISFWFRNTDLMLTHSGGGARPRKLADKMAGALVQFMKTGDPNGGGLPSWPRYTAARGETMVLDDVSVARDDPDREARKALPAV